MRRKGTSTPYILHPLEAASIVGTMTDDQDILAAAVLHDVVEDTDTTLEELEAVFGKRVAELVAAESENKRKEMPASASWQMRKEEAIALLQQTKDIGVKMIFLGDKLANMRSFKRDYTAVGESFYQRFNQTDPKMHLWYHRSIADAMPELQYTDAWKEYDTLIKEVFKEE